MSAWTVDVLLAARRVANFAEAEGALEAAPMPRPTLEHMGAVVADAVLQAGLNYASVVRPRVMAILQNHPEADRVSALAKLVKGRQVAAFLSWSHPTKLDRFEQLVLFLARSSVETSEDLRAHLGRAEFRVSLRTVSGVGPKTVDYLACLVGMDSIAVDRHVRAYAFRADVYSRDYDFLREVFCSAADLLSLSRRVFDAWVWRRESSASKFAQLALDL
jgi:hypothetical protein